MNAKNTFFLPYQQRWLQDTSRIKLMEKSRQIGMSWAAAYGLVRAQAVSQAPGGAGSGLDCWVTSRDELQAELFLNDCKRFAQLLNLAAPILSKQVRAQTRALTFASGRKIYSLSSNPDAQAGKRGTRVLDEFALHPQPERLYAVAYPGITWGGRLEIISTHRGEGNLFNQLVKEITEGGNPKNISHHCVTLQDALEQGFLEKLKQKLPKEDPRQSMDAAAYYNFIKASCVDEATFYEEYMCRPQSRSSQLLPYALLQQCAQGGISADEAEAFHISAMPQRSSARYFVGVDIGRVNDLTAIWVVELVGSVAHTRGVQVFKNAPFAQQEAALQNLLSHPCVRGLCIDASGMGRPIAERLTSQFSAQRVRGLTFTAPLKQHLAYGLRAALERGIVRLPQCPAVLADLSSVRRQYTQAGNVQLAAPTSHQGHGDRFWALALALEAADMHGGSATQGAGFVYERVAGGMDKRMRAH